MKYLWITILPILSPLASQASEPLSLEKLQELIATEHDETPLIEPLQIFPKARKHQVQITVRVNSEETATFEMISTKKWVDGRFIVSKEQEESSKYSLAKVIEFDQEEGLYKKYVVSDGEVSGYWVGTKIENSRSISWINLSAIMLEANFNDLTTETYTDTQTTWRSTLFREGEFKRLKTGIEKAVR